MRTVNEVVRDVLANPEAYTDAFPVSTPETGGLNWTNWTIFSDLNAPDVDLSGARLSPEAMELARQRMLREAVHNYWTDGNTRFVRDESHPRDRVTMVGGPLREDSVADRLRRGEWSGPSPSWRAIADEALQHMINMTAIDDPSMGTAERADAVVDAEVRLAVQNQPRPDHYRVSPGRCSCGFTSMFAGDMIDHIGGRVFIANNHQWTWRLCECGASALCREVVITEDVPVTWPPTFNPTGPTVHRVYFCDACCQRRGIR